MIDGGLLKFHDVANRVPQSLLAPLTFDQANVSLLFIKINEL